jgi:thiol-disulfide isomerase/thioredoxin
VASERLTIGSAAPPFSPLPGADGVKYSLSDFGDARALVIVFSCNHCPYVQAYEDRMIMLQSAYGPKGLRLVAINSNETVNYPEDNFEEMVKRFRNRGYNFPYLRDENQSVAEAYGATHTPEFFLFARSVTDGVFRLHYHGKMDDNYQNPAGVKERYLENALNAVLAGKAVAVPETHSIGCTIKWK